MIRVLHGGLALARGAIHDRRAAAQHAVALRVDAAEAGVHAASRAAAVARQVADAGMLAELDARIELALIAGDAELVERLRAQRRALRG